MNNIQLIGEDSHLPEVIERLSRETRVAVDIESNGFFRYHERVCLVQLATTRSAYLVDPLAIGNVRPLGDLLSNRSVEKVFHSADYDLRSLDRDWGFRVNNLFDTSIAAAFVGSARLGLQSVLKEYAGVESKKPLRLQRSDWSIRPLSPEARTYAADDVLHLLEARDVLLARLKKLSRLEWAMEEFSRLERVKHSVPDRALAFLSIKGSRDLDGRGLAVLSSLYRFREQEARRLDRPPFKVISNSALIQLSSQPEIDLLLAKGLGRFGHPPADRLLKAAIDEGLRSLPLTLQKPKLTQEELNLEELKKIEARLHSLRAWRRQLGKDLQLDPGLLWPAIGLKRLSKNPQDLDSEFASSEIRDWQQREFGTGLNEVLATLS